MFTMNGELSSARMNRSFMTDFTLLLEIIRALLISFIANRVLVFFFSTLQTLPKPPLPIA
jgi:hypothetical protein